MSSRLTSCYSLFTGEVLCVKRAAIIFESVLCTVGEVADLSQSRNALHGLLQQGFDDQVCEGSLLGPGHPSAFWI